MNAEYAGCLSFVLDTPDSSAIFKSFDSDNSGDQSYLTSAIFFGEARQLTNSGTALMLDAMDWIYDKRSITFVRSDMTPIAVTSPPAPAPCITSGFFP